MLKKTKRLTYSDFKSLEIFKIKKTGVLTLKIAKSPKSFGKHAVVVSKKIFKKAVNRNKARRRVYAILELLEKQGFFSNKFNYIWVVKDKNIANLKFDNLKQIIKNLYL